MIDPGSVAGRPRALDWANLPDQPLLTIARGTFSKALNLGDLWGSFIPLLIAVPLVLGLSVLLLKNRRVMRGLRNIYNLGVKKSCVACWVIKRCWR